MISLTFDRLPSPSRFFCSPRCCVAREQARGDVCPLPQALLPRSGPAETLAASAVTAVTAVTEQFDPRELPRRGSSFFCH